MKKQYLYRPQVRSRHKTHDVLRKRLPKFPFRTVIRLGSTTEYDDVLDAGGNRLEVNTVEGVKNSSNKRLMKECFTDGGVKTAEWWSYNIPTKEFTTSDGDGNTQIGDLPYPIVAKHVLGSRGTGNYLLKDEKALQAWLVNKDMKNYIFEKYYSYSREYRLHMTAEGCFYTCRKMLKADTPADQRWYRNDANSVWLIEENPQFDKPVNWDDIVNDCKLALESVGLDIAAFDVRVQSATDKKGNKREYPEWIILESNSAPSYADITTEKALEEIPKLVNRLAKAYGIID